MTENIRSNVYKHGTKILRAIAEHYESGGIETQESNHHLMQLFALVIEGKVSGNVCEDTGHVKWGLSASYEKELQDIEDARMDAHDGRNITKGPWL
jgi:hypothetical protein